MNPPPQPRVEAAPRAELLSTDAARPAARTRPVARWLVRLQHERHGVPQPPAAVQDAECGAEAGAVPRPDAPEERQGKAEVKSHDSCDGRGGTDDDECSTPQPIRTLRLGRGPVGAPCSTSSAYDDLPPPPHSLHQLDFDPPHHVPDSSPSRHSYGDFSSASSTASSSTSHSGFSSASASSFTSASSTQTFSAATAGWPVSPSTAAHGKAPQSLVGAVERAESDGGTPVPDMALEMLDLPATSHTSDETECGETRSLELVDKRLPPCPAEALDAAAVHVPPCPPTTTPCVPPKPDASLALHGSPSTSPPRPMPRAPSPSAASTATGGADASAENDDTDDELLRPPENFAMVSPKLYRSSFPRTRNFPFLRSLGLKSVMVLVQEPYPEENLEFLKREGILFFQFGMPANKEPFVSIPEDKIVAALSTILDVRNHPMLIHCNKGKHRTGCVVGCLRRLQLWSLVSVFDEYRRYSHPKSRAMDLQCIEAFGGLPKVWETVDRAHLPRWATLDPPPLPPTAPLPVGAASALSTDDETSSVGEP